MPGWLWRSLGPAFAEPAAIGLPIALAPGIRVASRGVEVRAESVAQVAARRARVRRQPSTSREGHMHRTMSIALVALLSLVLAACGGDDEDSGQSADSGAAEEQEFTDEQQITAAIEVWYGSDKTAACGILSDSALESIGGIEKCLGNAADPLKTKVEVSNIEVEGETATADATTKTGVAVPFELILDGDQWLVESPTPTIY
jgi:hypothetical protein